MSNKMTASILLKLEDQLSGGLAKLQKRLEALQAIFKKLSMDGLDDGLAQMQRATTQAQRLAQQVGRVGQSADATGAKLKRMAQQAAGIIEVNTAGMARMARAGGPMGMLALAGMAGGGMARLGYSGANGGMWTPQAMASIRGATTQPSWAFRAGMGAAGAWAGAKGLGEKVGPIGAAVGGYGMFKSIEHYADYENGLRHMAITQKMSGLAVEAEVVRLAKNFNADALGSGQRSTGIAKAANFLLTTGMPMATVDELMPIHARAATAYNVSSDSMGQAVFALHDSFKIGHEDMPGALSAMANAAKEGHFNVENFSRHLPEIGGSMNLLGMTGRKSADIAFAALETVVKNASNPSQAATDFNDLLRYMTQPIAVRSFAHVGIDLPGVMKNAEKRGINPLYAFLGKLDQLVTGKSDVDAAFTLGKVLHNQQAGVAALSLVRHKDQFLSLADRLHGAGKETLDTDFGTAFRAPKIQMELFLELIDQISRRLGEGFTPILQAVNIGLLGLVNAMKYLDENVPGSVNAILRIGGALLALAVGAGLVALLMTGMTAAFGVLAGPIGVLMILLVALASLIYDNADAIWRSVKPTLDAIAAVWDTLMAGMKSAIDMAINGIMGVWRGLLSTMQAMIADVWNWLANSVAGRVLNLKPMDDGRLAPGRGEAPDDVERFHPSNLGIRPGSFLPGNPPSQLTGSIAITIDPMGNFTGMGSFEDQPGLKVTVQPAPAPNLGPTIGRH